MSRAAKFSFAWLVLWSAATLACLAVSADHELSRALGSPEFPSFLGFDAFGRDLLTLVPKASAFSLAFALLAVGASTVVALFAGTGLAIAPNLLRFWMVRVLDFTLAFPPLLLALSWSALRGPGWDTLLVSLAIGTIPSFTRLVFVRSRELLSEEYVLAAESLGATRLRIVTRHLSPGIFSLCAVKAPNLFAHALLAEATLSFLGVGAPVGSDTWGTLLAQGREYLLEAPHIGFATGIPLILTVMSLQLLSAPSGIGYIFAHVPRRRAKTAG